jgi:hypothetical protein
MKTINKIENFFQTLQNNEEVVLHSIIGTIGILLLTEFLLRLV